jgi:methionine-rich copper-binding protein CopC
MTASPSPIAAVAPADGQQLTQSPQDLVITFSGLPVAALMGTYDVVLVEVNRDGTTTPLWDFDSAPLEESDDTGTELIIPMQTYDPSTFEYDNLNLLAGTYEIELVGGTGLSAFASGAFGPGPQLWDPSQDHPISEFTVLGQGATLSGATQLGTIGSTIQTIVGTLNPDQSQSAVDLYQFSVAPGHFWQVGLSVSAHGIGSSLLPALSLLDSSGNVIATRDSGQGLPSDPDDPYLFEGLKAGTYYVAVSDAGDLPYGPSGFDPIFGIPGTGGLRQSGGPFPFQLGVVATPHDQPTQLVNLVVDRADQTESSPTGLTLTFSAPIDLSKLFEPDAQEDALQVVDASGQIWPITAENYQVENAQLTLIFDQPLPAGVYTLVTSSEDGLNDLAGLPVVAAREPAGVLGSWSVAPPVNSHDTDNLGVIWPSTANIIWPTSAGAFARTTELAPGQEASFRWVVTVPGFFNLQTELASGQLSISNSGNGQTTVLTADNSQQLSTYLFRLEDGVYTLRFQNVGSGPLEVNWVLKIASLDWEKILDNGVAQSSILTLSSFTQSSTDSGPSLTNSQSLSGPQALSAFAGLSPSSSGPITPNLFLTTNTGPIGQPTVWSENVAVVGPTVEAGSIAMAESANGLGQGNSYGLMLDTSSSQHAEVPLTTALPARKDSLPDPATRLAMEVPSPRSDVKSESTSADRRALAQADWLIGLGARLKGWLGATPSTSGTGSTTTTAPGATMIAQDDHAKERARSNRSNRFADTAEADTGAAVSLMAVGVIACRLRRPLERWWRERKRLTANRPALSKPFCRGPHPITARARAMARPRSPRSVG